VTATIHKFSRSDAGASVHADSDWLRAAYKRIFPDLVAAPRIKADGWAQRGGIDRLLMLSSGRVISVDEKFREEEYQDFCLEYISDISRSTPGWIEKDLACDFISYVFVNSRRVYLLPVVLLRLAWLANRPAWIDRYRRIEAHNFERGRSWKTVSVAVPIDVVFTALTDAMFFDGAA
jgi:hypothetical protein